MCGASGLLLWTEVIFKQTHGGSCRHDCILITLQTYVYNYVGYQFFGFRMAGLSRQAWQVTYHYEIGGGSTSTPYAYIYIYVRMYVCMYAYVCVNVCASVCVCVFMFIYIYTYIKAKY